MKVYVAGFLFDKTRQNVALVLKNRPEWQAGKWNAIGGKAEPGESVEDAMSREFREETGVNIDSWESVVALQDPVLDWVVYFYRAFSDDIYNVKTVTDETIGIFPLEELPLNLVPKIRWLSVLSAAEDVQFPLEPITHIGECS